MFKLFSAALASMLFGLLPLPAASRATVGFLVKARSTEGFWGEVEKGARAAAEAAGVDLIVKGTPDSANSAAQLKLLDALVGQEIDALVIAPVDPERSLGPLQAYAAKGLKIVVGESELPAGAAFPFVGYDQTKLALAAGTAFAAALQPNDTVAVFRGVSDRTVVERDKVILARLKELRPNLGFYLDFFAVSTESSTVADKAGFLLQKHPDAKLFIATSSPTTSALLAAAKNQPGNGKIRIAGFGYRLSPETLAALDDGTMPTFVCQAPRDIGYKSVAAAVALIRGEPVPPRTDVAFFVVTKETLNDPAIQSLKVGK
jgi:ribose transport system substrate-binding protein